MTSRTQVFALLAPGALVFAVAMVFERSSGSAQTFAAAVAIGICWLATLSIFCIAHWIIPRRRHGAVFVMAFGTVLRMLVVVGGGASAYFGSERIATSGLGFWIWLLTTYLSTLVVEIVVLRTIVRQTASGLGGKG